MQNSEYEIQHFGFSVEQMKLERRHVIKQHLTSLLKHLVNSLVKKSNVSQETSAKVIDIQNKVCDKVLEAFAPTLKEIEKLDEENFSIPQNVVLDQDFGHLKHFTKDDEEKLVNQVLEMKKQFLENSVMISALEMENSKYLETQSIVQKELKSVHTVRESFTAINMQNTQQMVKNVLLILDK